MVMLRFTASAVSTSKPRTSASALDVTRVRPSSS